MKLQFIHKNEHQENEDITISKRQVRILLSKLPQENIIVYDGDDYLNVFSNDGDRIGDTISNVNHILHLPKEMYKEFTAKERKLIREKLGI